MSKYQFFTFITLFLYSCSNTSSENHIITSPIEADFSSILDPKERWEAYNLSDYSIEQHWSCECFAPNSCSTVVLNKVVEDVIYEIAENAYFGRSEKEIYDYTKKMAITIDEAFKLIEKYKNSADKIEVEYDPRFGFPTKIFIDINVNTADEEIIRRFDNLLQILN